MRARPPGTRRRTFPDRVLTATKHGEVLSPDLSYSSHATITMAMKARVHVSLKPSVLDPQGQTISTALNGFGYSSVQSVRQGKYFDLELDDSLSQDEARAQLEKVAHEVLANPVIEEYQVELIS